MRVSVPVGGGAQTYICAIICAGSYLVQHVTHAHTRAQALVTWLKWCPCWPILHGGILVAGGSGSQLGGYRVNLVLRVEIQGHAMVGI